MAGSARASAGLSPLRHLALARRPLEQMGSISYFVTPVGRAALRFREHPRTCDLFQRRTPRYSALRRPVASADFRSLRDAITQ